MDTKQPNLTGLMWPCLFGITTPRSVGVFSPMWTVQNLSFHSHPGALPRRWDLIVCESTPGWLSEKRKKRGFQFLASPPPGSGRVRDQEGSCQGYVVQLEWIAGQIEQHEKLKTSPLSAFIFFQIKQNKIPFLRVLYDSVFFFFNPLVAYRLQKQSWST